MASSDVDLVAAVASDDPAPPTGTALPGLDALPGPAPTPVLGWRGNLVRFFRDPIDYLDGLAGGGHGDLVTFARGMDRGLLRPGKSSPGAVLALGPSHNQTVLTRPAFAPLLLAPKTPSLARLQSGLLWMHGDKHKQQRRLIAPAFHPRRLAGYRDALVAIAEETLAGWTSAAQVDVLDEGRRILIRFLTQAIFGLDGTPEVVALGAQMEDVTHRSMSPAAMIPLDLPLTPHRRLIQRADQLLAAMRRLIAAKRTAGDAGDMLTTLIHARDEDGSAMTEDELLGQLFLLFFAGFESSTSVLAWTSYLLAQHPEVAAELHHELATVLGGAAPTLEQLEQLPVLDRVIKESLRLIPPVYMLTRSPTTAVDMGGHHLPAGVEVFLSIYHTHRRPELYEAPTQFRPERWRSTSTGGDAASVAGPFGYLPFGAGAHMCVGWALATMELKILLAMITQRFRLGLADGTQIDRRALAVVAPRPGVRMQLCPQDRQFERSRGRLRGHFTAMVDLGD